jgi:cobyrinic acid a,c-diamide synthase
VNASATNPRLVIAGMSGDSGKTLLALGLLFMLRERGHTVRAFKKGPDYIDAAWLSWAAGHPARNLDTYLMGFDVCTSSFLRSASANGFNIIEGNRGLYDGLDARGTHSTAELAKSLEAPVLLIVNATKATRTAAAWVLGCQWLDPQVQIGGVVLNQVNGTRHERLIRDAIQKDCGIPVLGALPRAASQTLLPARHLGLVTPDEHPRIGDLMNNLMDLVQDRLDLDRIIALSSQAPALQNIGPVISGPPVAHRARVGFLRDSALSFYYPENLEILEKSGASLVPISPLTATELPRDLDALYIGGGFPETHGADLSANRGFLQTLRSAAHAGLPIYAECGGLMLLSQGIRWNAARFPMAGVLPFEVEVFPTPQGHGYVELLVDRPNPFFRQGLAIRGHEFHYSRIITESAFVATACEVKRGTGCGRGRDGLIQGSVWASYTHLHALGTPEWAEGLLAAAMEYSGRRLR